MDLEYEIAKILRYILNTSVSCAIVLSLFLLLSNAFPDHR